MRKTITIILLGAVGAVALCAFACSNWDQQTYQTLAASKAVIDQIAVDYNAGRVPQTPGVANAITKAREAQRAAVQAFQVYAAAEIAAQPGATVAARQQAVVAALALVPPAIDALRQAIKSPN